MKEIEGLPLFAKVVELKSFAEAARQMQLPTTTVSRKIRQLEVELGGKLLNRTTRSLSLTELGERILPKAILIQETISELSNEAAEFSSEPVGTLRIDGPRAFCQSVLTPLLCEFHKQYPGINIHLDADNRMQDLTKSSVDFAFRIGELKDSSLVALSLGMVDHELVASPHWVENNWLKNGKVPTHPQDLIHYSTIRNQVEGYTIPWQFSKGGQNYTLESEPKLLSNDMLASVNFALNDTGVACLPVSFVKTHISDGKLIALLPDWQKQSSKAHMLYPGRKHLPQKSRLFIAFVRKNLEYFKDRLSSA